MGVRTNICLYLPEAVQPAAAEGQRAKVLVDEGEKAFGSGSAEWLADVTGLVVLHVVGALHVLVHHTSAWEGAGTHTHTHTVSLVL